jgi:hypothetical protein
MVTSFTNGNEPILREIFFFWKNVPSSLAGPPPELIVNAHLTPFFTDLRKIRCTNFNFVCIYQNRCAPFWLYINFLNNWQNVWRAENLRNSSGSNDEKNENSTSVGHEVIESAICGVIVVGQSVLLAPSFFDSNKFTTGEGDETAKSRTSNLKFSLAKLG